MPSTQIRVTPNESGRMVIDVLAIHRGSSRRKAKDLLDRRLVFINGRRIWMARHLLRTGDLIEIIPTSPAPPCPDAAVILFQDSDYLITDKPAGIVTNGPHSLETRLQTALNLPALAAVHRLDRGTSGCLMFAKHAAAQQRILPLFAERKLKKTYQAMVVGTIQKPRFTITKPIARQSAITDIHVVDTNRQASHLRITIQTGRTHQIRKHLTAIGHPILGDPYYATKREISPLEQRLQRPMLHAFQLSFTQPLSGAPIRCIAPLPADFRKGLTWFHLR